VPDPEVTTTLGTGESILIDGANGVTSAPRAHFPHGGWWLGLALVVALIVRVVKRPLILLGMLVAGAIPGLVHLLVLRADAPLQRFELAGSISTTLDDVQHHAPWPQTQVSIIREDDALFPLGRYAFPSRKGGPLEVELRAGVGTCRQETPLKLICGGAQ
jgi:hypothetical protein